MDEAAARQMIQLAFLLVRAEIQRPQSQPAVPR